MVCCYYQHYDLHIDHLLQVSTVSPVFSIRCYQVINPAPEKSSESREVWQASFPGGAGGGTEACAATTEYWCVLQCSAVQCSAVQCSAVQCSAVQCSVQGSRGMWPLSCEEEDSVGVLRCLHHPLYPPGKCTLQCASKSATLYSKQCTVGKVHLS